MQQKREADGRTSELLEFSYLIEKQLTNKVHSDKRSRATNKIEESDKEVGLNDHAYPCLGLARATRASCDFYKVAIYGLVRFRLNGCF
jgi:hypothetical protein